MKNRRRLLLSLLFLIGLIAPCYAKAWHNIFPLKTTRSEVVKLLGNPREVWTERKETFEAENGTAQITWTNPNCSAEDPVLERSAVKSDSVAYQITFVPKDPLPREFVEKEKQGDPETEDAADLENPLFEFYSISCLKGDEGTFSCRQWNRMRGFGYSNTNLGVHALYYFPANKELDIWKARLKPCSNEQDKVVSKTIL
jgi:hypothetical protein